MTVDVVAPEEASDAVLDICMDIENIFNADVSKIILDALDKKFSELTPDEKEQLKKSIISENNSHIQAITPSIEIKADVTPYPYPETEVGQINPSSLPFDNDEWGALIDLLKKHKIIP